jgi:hypothetical protein
MFAMVARTVSIGRMSCRIPAAGSHQAARVTHTLLFLAAQILVLAPGVCDACVKGCCESGTPRIADVASPFFHGVFAGSAGAGGCEDGHCCGVTATDDVAADPCGDAGPEKCQCQLEPRSIPPAAAAAGQPDRRGSHPRWDDGAGVGAMAWLPPVTGQWDGRQPTARAVHGGAAAIPTRPVRVLYGVWRN